MTNIKFGQSTISQTLFMIFSVVALRCVMDFGYVWFVAPLYDYAGFYLEPDPTRYATSWCLLLLSLIAVPSNVKKPSDFFHMLAICFLIVPNTSYLGLSDIELYPVLVTVVAVAATFFVVRSAFTPVLKFPVIKSGSKLSITLSIFLTLLVCAWFVRSGAIAYFNLDLSLVYEFRQDSSDLSAQGIFIYLNNWVYKVFAPFVLAWGLLNKRPSVVILALCMAVFLFGVSAHKSVLFTPIAIIGCWFFFQKSSENYLIPFVLAIAISLALVSYFQTKDIMTASILLRRMFFIPSMLTQDYFFFFQNNDNIYWSNSVLSSFNDYPYGSLPLALVVSDSKDSLTYANNGYISSGFAHAGLLGVGIYCFIFGVIIKQVNALMTKEMPLWLTISIVVIPVWTAFVSSDLSTVFLTHGLGISVILLVLARKQTAPETQVSYILQPAE